MFIINEKILHAASLIRVKNYKNPSSAKLNPREMLKNSPSAKLNPREKLKIWCSRKLIHAKINPLKIYIYTFYELITNLK